jgi:hypothetical protein
VYRHTAGAQGSGDDAGTGANLEHPARRQPGHQVGGDTLAADSASATFVVLIGDPIEVERDTRHAGTLTHTMATAPHSASGFSREPRGQTDLPRCGGFVQSPWSQMMAGYDHPSIRILHTSGVIL